MKKIFIINGVEPYSWAPGRLNETFVNIAREYFESNGCEVNVTKVCEEYDIEAEVDKIAEADLVILQFPLEWFNVSWSCKKYFDTVLIAGQGKHTHSDGRHHDRPKEGYGTGGLLTGKYMLSVTQNTPIEAFGNLSETFFNGITPDQMLTPIHLTFRFIGLTPVSSFFSSDVVKNPTIPEDIERYKEHLRHYFPFK
ncbi:MAG: NAD(P)H-dependent oxidoreductase [Muribaculaceae bacterium]|nr:NAD(P)H-dependent oxidoreductase [Muribaculaceae bacterium]